MRLTAKKSRVEDSRNLARPGLVMFGKLSNLEIFQLGCSYCVQYINNQLSLPQ